MLPRHMSLDEMQKLLPNLQKAAIDDYQPCGPGQRSGGLAKVATPMCAPPQSQYCARLM